MTPTTAQDALIKTQRERIEYLEEQVKAFRQDLRPATMFPEEWELTPNEAIVLAVLTKYKTPRDGLLIQAFRRTMTADDDRGDPRNDLEVYVCRLRQKLDVKINRVWGKGYWMEPEVRARFKAHLVS